MMILRLQSMSKSPSPWISQNRHVVNGKRSLLLSTIQTIYRRRYLSPYCQEPHLHRLQPHRLLHCPKPNTHMLRLSVKTIGDLHHLKNHPLHLIINLGSPSPEARSGILYPGNLASNPPHQVRALLIRNAMTSSSGVEVSEIFNIILVRLRVGNYRSRHQSTDPPLGLQSDIALSPLRLPLRLL